MTGPRDSGRDKARLEALRDVSSSLSASLDITENLYELLDRIAAVLKSERALLFQAGNKGLVAHVREGRERHEIRFAPGEGIAGDVAKTGRIANVKDAYQDPRFHGVWDQRMGSRTRTLLAVPLRNAASRVTGVLQVVNRRDGTYTDEDVVMAETLAGQLAVALENSRLFTSVVDKNMELLEAKEQLESRVQELDALYEIASVAASSATLDEMLSGIIARAMRAMQVDAAAIYIEGQPMGELRFRVATDVEQASVQVVRVPAGEGISGWVAKHGRALRLVDVARNAQFSDNIAERVRYIPRRVLSVPLSWDQGRGALSLFDKRGGDEAFTDEDMRIAVMLSKHVASAIGLALARIRRDNEQRLSAIGQFMSGVLHDMKTPMAVIQGYVQLMTKEEDPDDRRQYADVIAKQLSHIQAMTQETLAFARGDTKVWIRKVLLNHFFEELAEQIKLQVEGRNIQFRLTLSDRGVAYFDPHKMVRAIHNLVRNSIQALGKRGGKLELKVDRNTSGALRIRTVDNGPGIPEEIRERLFESFSTHGKATGTGLGLAIVKAVADEHGGTVSFRSKPGLTEFTLEIPDQAEQSPSLASKALSSG